VTGGKAPVEANPPEVSPEVSDADRRPEPDRTPEDERVPEVSDADRAAVTAQLGRPPRGMRGVAHRCPCGLPAVVRTNPRLDEGTPFPTLYYLTCSRLCSLIGGLEARGRMREMTERLRTDPELAEAYRRAHERYLAERDAIEPLGTQVTAGGMPNRVKCLHALVGHALAAGPGVNPFGDEALAELGAWWRAGPCVRVEA
jgi:uncharacterized protein